MIFKGAGARTLLHSHHLGYKYPEPKIRELNELFFSSNLSCTSGGMTTEFKSSIAIRHMISVQYARQVSCMC